MPPELAEQLLNMLILDPATKSWLLNHLDPVFGFPTLVRYSWSTCSKLLEDKAHKVNW
jgi:ribonuclease H2 subunit A